MEKRKLPMVPSGIRCEDCNGACCQAGTILKLTESEHQMMLEAGGTLGRVPGGTRAAVERMLIDSGLSNILGNITISASDLESYALLADCPFLHRAAGHMALCGIHGERQPQICRDFQAGSPGCLEMRAARFPGAEPPANE